MTNSIHKSTETELRTAIESISDQLCETIEGRFDFNIDASIEDESIEKLVMLINFLLNAVGKTLTKLKEREARTVAIVDSAAEGIITINERGYIETFNAAASKIFGYRPTEVIGLNVSKLVPTPHRQQHNEYLARYLQTGKANIIGQERELEAVRKGGTIFPIRIAISEVDAGDHRLFTAIVWDLSEQKIMECQLAQAQKLESIGQLAAGIAHEINTPTQYVGDNTRFLQDAFGDLCSVLAKYQQLLDAAKNGSVDSSLVEEVERTLDEADLSYLSEEIPKSIQQSLEGVERVAKIVRAMKEFSHPGAEEKTPININEAIQTTITVASNEWKYVADVKTDLDANLPSVPCLPGELNQVILNLIVNAAHAIADVVKDETENKGTITVSTRQDADWAEIQVRDTGTGIPEKIKARIFDPFFTTKEVGKGTGQGLAMVHSVVVDKHGGSITCNPNEPTGTIFSIRLPLHLSPQS